MIVTDSSVSQYMSLRNLYVPSTVLGAVGGFKVQYWPQRISNLFGTESKTTNV